MFYPLDNHGCIEISHLIRPQSEPQGMHPWEWHQYSKTFHFLKPMGIGVFSPGDLKSWGGRSWSKSKIMLSGMKTQKMDGFILGHNEDFLITLKTSNSD